MKYKLFIFDMGGVLLKNFNVRPDIYKCLNINDKQFFDFAGDELQEYSDGKISSSCFWGVFSQRYGKEIKEELFGKFFKPEVDRKTSRIIKTLKQKTRVVCGTNTIEPHYDYLIKKGYYDIFDAVYASNKMGISKPNSEFYTYILNEEKVKADETIFVDDMEENVKAALSLGINSILFEDPESLAKKICFL
ncbi:HAD-IA family hydrolase [Halocella sp. SP3-1]|uniref:HAD-IA family hydrolase n=1 Tax=Halocella sp. SP3-1 TaxID=2382161 RepID=UPI000F75F2CC|nr:HAD-IA family hydrolase [Halocella sp. SP3-1]AZO93415.1 HAD family phosphatase [Halocella sp. SP3-1]